MILLLLVVLVIATVLLGGRLLAGAEDPEAAPAGHGTGRVLVVSGSYGAGHDAAAREVRRALEAEGRAVDVTDVAALFPAGIGHLLRAAYFTQLGTLPGSWRTVLNLLDRRDGPAGVVADVAIRALALFPARGLLKVLGPGYDEVVSTHPFASLALGRLRRTGQLVVPVTTYLTDASVHRLWVANGVDRHVAVHPEAARQARDRVAADVHLVRPLVSAHVTAMGDLRERWGVPAGRATALVVGGAEGVGDLELTARDLRDTGLVTPVVVCGRNDQLRRRLDREPGVVALGWLDGLAGAIAASDVVVHNAGGFTTLEALQLGRPVVSYRCLPGHGEENARALAADGTAAWPRDPDALADALAGALAVSTRSCPAGWDRRPALAAVLRRATIPTTEASHAPDALVGTTA